VVRVNVQLSLSFKGNRFKVVELPDNTPLSELSSYLTKSGVLLQLQDNIKHMAYTSFNYTVNARHIPLDLQSNYFLQDGDNVMILLPLAGG
jgi:molybdopterin converting factor small subunit